MGCGTYAFSHKNEGWTTRNWLVFFFFFFPFFSQPFFPPCPMPFFAKWVLLLAKGANDETRLFFPKNPHSPLSQPRFSFTFFVFSRVVIPSLSDPSPSSRQRDTIETLCINMGLYCGNSKHSTVHFSRYFQTTKPWKGGIFRGSNEQKGMTHAEQGTGSQGIEG